MRNFVKSCNIATLVCLFLGIIIFIVMPFIPQWMGGAPTYIILDKLDFGWQTVLTIFDFSITPIPTSNIILLSVLGLILITSIALTACIIWSKRFKSLICMFSFLVTSLCLFFAYNLFLTDLSGATFFSFLIDPAQEMYTMILAYVLALCFVLSLIFGLLMIIFDFILVCTRPAPRRRKITSPIIDNDGLLLVKEDTPSTMATIEDVKKMLEEETVEPEVSTEVDEKVEEPVETVQEEIKDNSACIAKEDNKVVENVPSAAAASLFVQEVITDNYEPGSQQGYSACTCGCVAPSDEVKVEEECIPVEIINIDLIKEIMRGELSSKQTLTKQEFAPPIIKTHTAKIINVGPSIEEIREVVKNEMMMSEVKTNTVEIQKTPIIVSVPTSTSQIKEEQKDYVTAEEVRLIIKEELSILLGAIKISDSSSKEVEKEVETPIEVEENTTSEVIEEEVTAVIPPVSVSINEQIDSDLEQKAEKQKIIRIPFQDRILVADDTMKKHYNELKSDIMAYGVNSRVSSSGDAFRLHRKTYVKIAIAGKSLKLYLALDPRAYADTTLPISDASAKQIYAEIPLVFKVKSDLSLRRAKQLIADAMSFENLVQGEVIEKDWVSIIKEQIEEESEED